MELQKINYRHDYKYLEEFFLKEYNLDKIEKDYFKYMDFDYFISATEDENNELFEIIGKIDKIMLKAYDFYYENLEDNLTKFYPFLRYFHKKYPIKNHFVGRYDILIDDNDGQYKFLETNANTPGMITEIYNIARLQRPVGYTNQGTKYIKYTKEFFKKYVGKKIGILLAHSFEDEDYLIGIDYYKMISEVVGEENVIIGDIFESNIIADKEFYLKGEKIDVILSFFPLEFFLTDIDFSDGFFKVINSGGCILHNPIESIILQDKLIFAVIYENLERFTKKEIETIKKHIPFTTREFQDDEERFIMKARFGRISRDVFENKFHTNTGNEASEWIFQEKVKSKIQTENGDFMVIGGFTNYKNPICLVGRRGKQLITKDENTNITLLYLKK